MEKEMTQCHIETKDTELTEKQKEYKRKNIAAFPVNIYEGKWVDGMALRDYFAAKVLSGIMASGDSYNISLMAEYSYQLADAMMKAREE
jgi:hypothetical protein